MGYIIVIGLAIFLFFTIRDGVLKGRRVVKKMGRAVDGLAGDQPRQVPSSQLDEDVAEIQRTADELRAEQRVG